MQKDILIMSCDVITDYPLTRLIQLYRVHNPTLIALMQNVSSCNETVPGRKGKEKIGQIITKLTEFQIIYLFTEKDFIGIDKDAGDRLVFLSSEADFEDSISFKMSIFKRFVIIIKINLILINLII